MTLRQSILCLAGCLMATAGMTWAQAGGTYTQIDGPGSNNTVVYGINTAGDMVGGYVDSNQHTHGFLISGGQFTTFDVPGSPDTTGME